MNEKRKTIRLCTLFFRLILISLLILSLSLRSVCGIVLFWNDPHTFYFVGSFFFLVKQRINLPHVLDARVLRFVVYDICFYLSGYFIIPCLFHFIIDARKLLNMTHIVCVDN